MQSNLPKWLSVPARALALAATLAGVLSASTALAAPATDASRVTLAGSVHALATPQSDIGRSDLNLAMDRMVLSLKLRAGAQAELDQLLAAQHDPHSPQFHKWLTPEQFGAKFGLGAADLLTVANWLTSHGFHIDEVATGRGWINFSGTVKQVESAFATEIHDYQIDGKIYHANSVPASIPSSLASLANGVVTLHSFPRPSHHGTVTPVDPHFTSGGSHYVAPADFATIYNLNSAYSSGYTGTGQTIAIVGRTDIALSDVTTFRSTFGLPANSPTFVHNGADPGDVGGGEETEADLDVEWSGAVAKNATLKFVISKSTASTDGVDLSAQYIVQNNLAVAMSTSFGQCESQMGASELSFYNNMWSQAATQGITSFISSGDSGASGCDSGSATTGSGRAVSGLCSTPYNVCVGGSQFNDTANPSLYWSASNSSSDGSALSYIPEVAWNESGTVSGGSGLWSTGGGASNTYAKPSWQAGPGVPADSKRDVPDISLTAAGHDGYLVYQGGGLYSVGGTSASSPSMMGLMALVVQKAGARQGNANTVFYPMAAAQYGGTGPAVFHDVTSGNNSVPGVTGFNAGVGYDQATGVGTVDGTALINNWGGTASFALTVSKAGTGTGTVTSNPAGINCGATCSANYTSGTPVTLTAAASAGSSFTGWSGAGCSGTGTCQVTMSAAQSVTATFTATQSFLLSVTDAGTGTGTVTSNPSGINCGATCSASYASGTPVTLTAAASAGSTFAGWSGAGCSGTGTCQVTMTAAQSVTATFTAQAQSFTLSVTDAGSGTGTVTSSPAGISCGGTCSASYTSGTLVTLTATPASGSTFGGWSGACSGTGSCQVTMTAARSVTATFTGACGSLESGSDSVGLLVGLMALPGFLRRRARA